MQVMKEQVDAECCDLLQKNVACDRDEVSFLDGSTPVEKKESSQGYLTRRNIQFSRPPARDICNLAVSTFEKMDIKYLRTLEKLNDELKSKGKIGIETLKTFALKIMTEVWDGDEELVDLLKSDAMLTQTIGRELLVLFDNVMAEPVYEVTKTGKPQRYTKACLDNSILPVYDDKVPENRRTTFETVISTYTSPTAFTPEMESLMSYARRLGISTDCLNLKTFVTERSLGAFLKALIRAKVKKNAFMGKFNTKLLSVLHNRPEENEPHNLQQKFKFSFSKLYQFGRNNEVTRSTPEFHNESYKKYVANKIYGNNRSRYSITNRSIKFNNRAVRHLASDDKKDKNSLESTETICRKCHEPYCQTHVKYPGLVRSMSDSCLSLPTCDSITDCQCFDSARKAWDKSDRHASLHPMETDGLRTKPIIKSSLRAANNKTDSRPESEKLNLLSEQRSFFRFGEGALRDALTEYVTVRNQNLQFQKKTAAKKKKVRWVDETSLRTFYDSIFDSATDLSLSRNSDEMTDKTILITDKTLAMLLPHFSSHFIISGPLALADKPARIIMMKAMLQATLIAFVLWLSYILYSRTPEIADLLKRIRLI